MLNAELKEKGYIVVRGKVNTKYFFKKHYLQRGVGEKKCQFTKMKKETVGM